MLDARYVADNLEKVRERLATRSFDVSTLAPLVALSGERRALIVKTEAEQARRNAASAEMAELAKGPDKALFQARREDLKKLSDEVKRLEEEVTNIEARMEESLAVIPNLPHDSVPVGHSEADNRVLRVWGEKPEFGFEPKPHWDVGAGLGVLDFERASRLSGARFSVLTGNGARLERALIHFMLELHTREHGYREVCPPLLVRAEALRGTGLLPKFEQDLFKTFRADPEDQSALYLIPTAEVPLTNLHGEEILEAAQLPIAYTAFTPCFRSEAGSYGRDVRGLIRQHQFDKVELVRFCDAEQGLAQLELLTGHAEEVLKRLGLHYRVVELCSGDLGFQSAKTYDLEVWLPSQNCFREISSCSWCGDFQARRAKIRYRSAPKAKPQFAHTLNGSGLAVGRTWVAIMEQYQQPDGSVLVPEVLRPFMGTDRLSPE
ncbi:MAG: serine--tRNA ligase [Polyangiaceae bacterium]|nr:serine--tRNA ligase [Polyangiaceae bacterium]